MLIPIKILPNGDVQFDHTTVNSIGFLREVNSKFGDKAVAAVILYGDVLSPYRSMPNEVKLEELKESFKLKDAILNSEVFKTALKGYEDFIKETAIGLFVIGTEQKMKEAGTLMIDKPMTLDTMEMWMKTEKARSEMPTNYIAVRDAYKVQEDQVKKKIKGRGDKGELTQAEKLYS